MSPLAVDPPIWLCSMPSGMSYCGVQIPVIFTRVCAPQADSGDARDQRASPDGQDSQRNFRLAFHKS